ncbi:hypothetical protein O9X90_01975 [Agrobacterium leguminum]|uniref:hypothetical protein n=1 Tax=Agrobacterium leguminum TaxID=2792015 RepID=UPI0022B80962|nr:hypothetical protein [Agrobacterium leguminum]MCZ7931065.1 hypothetical protein [Agrobacterium leguminum]
MFKAIRNLFDQNPINHTFNGVIDATIDVSIIGQVSIVTFPDRVEKFTINKFSNNKILVDRCTIKDGKMVYFHHINRVSDDMPDLTDYFPIDVEAYNDQNN